MLELEESARCLLSSAILGGDWLDHLEPMMSRMNAIGGGPARTVPPKLFAIPTGGLRDLFMDFRAGRCPPLTRHIFIPATASDGFVADYRSPAHHRRAIDPFFAEFMRPHGACHQAAAFLDDTDGGCVRLLVFRNDRQGRFETDELSGFARSLPYLRAAAMVSRGALRTMARQQAEPFERRGEPVLYLGSDARIIEMNETAERSAGRSFGTVGRRLVSMWQPDQRRLDRALVAALVEARPGLVTLRDVTGSATMALVLPVCGDAKDVFHAISIIVVIIDPLRKRKAEEAAIGLLKDAAGLTMRELDVVRLVGMGRSPKDAAGDLGIGYGTLRNYLKAGFVKLGVHTQAELVALVQRLC